MIQWKFRCGLCSLIFMRSSVVSICKNKTSLFMEFWCLQRLTYHNNFWHFGISKKNSLILIPPGIEMYSERYLSINISKSDNPLWKKQKFNFAKRKIYKLKSIYIFINKKYHYRRICISIHRKKGKSLTKQQTKIKNSKTKKSFVIEIQF